jgi:integrase
VASVVERRTSKGDRRLYVTWRDRAGRQRWTLTNAKTIALLPGETSFGKKAADRLKRRIEESVERHGTWPPPDEVRAATAGTLGAYGDDWLETYARPNVRERVRVNYETSWRLHVKPLLGDREIASIRPSDGRQLVAAMREKKLSDSTIKNAIVPLREMLAHAAEDGLLLANPLAGVRLFGNRKQSGKKIVPPTRDQIEKMIEKARTQDAREAVRVAAAIGVRRGELFALRWSDLDFDQNTIHVHDSNYGGKLDEETKTEAGDRHVPIFKSIRGLLLERRARQEFSRDDNLVFGSIIGSPVDPGNFVRREFKKAQQRAGLGKWVDEEDGRRRWVGAFRWHDLRHYAVTELIAQGADIKLLQAIAGHKDATMTLNVYGHLMTERVSEAADLYDPLGVAAGV